MTNFLTILLIVILVPVVLYAYLTFWGMEKREEKSKKKLQDNLMEGESAVVMAHEVRIYALLSRRSLIGVTNTRVILKTRRVLGGFEMMDIYWKDIVDSEVSENIFPYFCGAKISFSNGSQKRIITLNIPSDAAFQIYKFAQKEKQVWEEKRRRFLLEKARAKAGGTYVTTTTAPPSPAAPAASSMSPSMLDELKKAQDLLERGVITYVEFTELKAKILERG